MKKVKEYLEKVFNKNNIAGMSVAVVINTENNEHLRYEITDSILNILTNN